MGTSCERYVSARAMSESMHIVMVSFGPLGSTTTVTGARPPFAAANWSSWVCSRPDTIQSCGAPGCPDTRIRTGSSGACGLEYAAGR